jgi:hypothetical protein
MQVPVQITPTHRAARFCRAADSCPCRRVGAVLPANRRLLRRAGCRPSAPPAGEATSRPSGGWAPGRVMTVGRDPAEHHAHEDVHVAIRDAFGAVRAQASTIFSLE